MLINLLSRFFLAFALILSSAPFHMSPTNVAFAEEDTNSSDEPEKNIDQEIRELKDAFLNPEKNTAALDPFNLTGQVVVDEREKNVEAAIKDSIEQDYKERVSYFENQVAELDDLATQVLTKIASEKDPIKLAELNTVLSDIESRVKITKIELNDLEGFDPSKGTPLPLDHMIDTDLRTRHFYGRNLRINLNYEDGFIQKISQKEFNESRSPGFDKLNPVDATATFEIATPKGVVMHKFMKPVEALFFYGPYLVYVETDSFDKSRGVQEVKFIDLNYFRVNIGNAPLPVFTLPVKMENRPARYTIENGYLKVGDQKLSHPQIDILSKTQRVMFNVNAALVDPSTYDNAKPLIDDIGTFFESAMKGQEALFQQQMQNALASESLIAQSQNSLNAVDPSKVESEKVKLVIEEALKDKKITDDEYAKITDAFNLDQENVRLLGEVGLNLTASNTALHASRKLMTRIKLLTRFLMQPRPEGAPKIYTALVMSAFGDKETRGRISEFTKNSFGYKMAKYGAATGGTILAAATISPVIHNQLSQSLDLISSIHQHYIGYLEHIDYGKNYVELSKDAVITSVSGWTYIFESYLSDGKWTKFLYGLGTVLMIPVKLFAGIHFTVNTFKMFNKTKALRTDLSPENRIGFIRSFIKAAEAENKSYWDLRSEAEKKVSGSDVNDMTEEDLKLLDEHLARLKGDKNTLRSVREDLGTIKRSSLKRFKKGFSAAYKKSKSIFSYVNFAKPLFSKITSRLKLKSDDNLFAGLSNAFFSYSALTSTFKTNSNIWNALYVVRSFAFSPSKLLMFVIYPNYFSKAISQPGKQHFPSHYNGGLESWVQKLRRLPLPDFAKKPFGQYFLSKDALANLRAFENSVAKAEAVMMETAFKKAQMALIERIDDPDKLLALFESKAKIHPLTKQATVTTGIKSLHDEKIKTLSKADKIFFRAYYTRVFDTSMQAFVNQTLGVEEQVILPTDDFAKSFVRELKQNKDYLERDANPENADIIKLIDAGDIEVMNNWTEEANKKVETSIDFDAIKAFADKMALGGGSFLKKLDIKYRHKLLETIHPGNAQLSRYLTAKEKVQDPRAMARATREEVTGLVSSIPIGIASMLALYAGVQSGVMQPFDANGLNSETHYLYMSRNMFYAGFVPGIIIGLMANTWMKVQTDARIDAIGGFDSAIKFSDSKRGFWRFYFKNFFKNPKNKWRENHTFMLKLIWSNIPAAAVTILVSQTYGLGRIDPGIILSGYVMIFASALIGFNTKQNQAFELATSWVFDKIPRKFRAHPKAQKYLEVQVQKKRIFFGWFENIWEIVVQENISGDMLTLKDNDRIGTRAFFRLMFGGETPTQILVNFADKLKMGLLLVPGVETVIEGFKHAISNNFEAFERFTPELNLVPDRLLENPDLPKSFFGELIGKASGLLVSVGIFAATPYVITDQMERQTQRNVQRRGEAAKAKGTAMSCGAFL
jgi:hypothetical protein